MKSSLRLRIISAEKRIFTGEVSSVIVPGISGRFGIHPGHAPLISSLEKGIIEYIAEEGTPAMLEVDGGVIEVKNGVITICVV